jgi:hypothetical protein
MKLLNKKSDQELVQAYVKGEERALQVLLERYKTKIYTSIYHQVKDQYLAEDIFQHGTSVLRGSRLDHRVDRPDVEGRTNDCRS